MTDFIKQYAKGIAAFLVTVIGGGITQGLINGAAAAWAMVIIGSLATIGVVGFKNADPPSPNGA